MKWEKEALMTNVLLDIKDFIKTEDIKETNPNPKIEFILDFIMLKIIAGKSKNEIEKYTERNKKIRNGKTVILGTRITPKELIDIMLENKEDDVFEYISKQYPSIDSKEKIRYGILYEIKRTNMFLFILKVLFGNNNENFSR